MSADEPQGSYPPSPSSSSSSSWRGADTGHGFLAYMAEHPVAANLLMVIFLVGGIVMAQEIRQKVFPDYELHEIRINVSYSGASPDDIERAMVRPVEEAIQNIPGIDNMQSLAREGGGRVTVELVAGANEETVMGEIQAAVDSISTFPDGVDPPNVSLRSARIRVLEVVVYGDADERTIREIAARTREGLLADPDITRVALVGMRRPEMHVEVSETTLRARDLTINEIADAISEAAVEVPGGGLRTPGGEILVRTDERKEQARDFEDIVVVAGADGANLRLSDIADVKDGFQELNRITKFNGKTAARLNVDRVGDQSPLRVSKAVHRYLEEYQDQLPPGVYYDVWDDESKEFSERIDLLLGNAYLGLILVLLVLGLFLNVKLAFWVTLGIPIAVLGSLIFMPLFGVSFNMISLFAFILTLGILVDYAIVVGESIYKQREEGLSGVAASIAGVSEVAGPLCISLLTTATVFLPLLAIPGTTGQLFATLPVVVILILVLALVEALLILPAHLARSKPARWPSALAGVMNFQKRFGKGLDDFIDTHYRPWLSRVLEVRYFTMAAGFAILLFMTALVMSGRISFTFFPPVEGDVAAVNLRMPFGTDAELTHGVADEILRIGQEVLAEMSEDDDYQDATLTEYGRGAPGSGPTGNAPGARSHITKQSIRLVPADERPFTTAEFTEKWRHRVGEIAGVEALLFDYSSGLDTGAAISINLHHSDRAQLERAAEDLSRSLRELQGVADVDSGVSHGKEQLDIRLRPEARHLGLTETSLGNQLRAAFVGVEALRMYRGHDELRVFVRRPLSERQSEHAIEQMVLRTPDGGEVPLVQAATIERGRGAVMIRRHEGRRVVNVSASIEPETTTGNDVMNSLRAGPLPDLMSAYPGLDWSLDGEQREQEEAISQLIATMLLAFFAMYVLLAFAFRSYFQPFVVMIVAPFACIGAILGHLVMGMGLSFLSVMGMIALCGIVVNASLILLSTTNAYLRQGFAPGEAIVAGACRRFRPIVLTAATTFIGLTPMIFESSVQAEFLVPMAISMGFGILFGTVVCLFFAPCTFMIFDDIRRAIEAGKQPDDTTGPEDGDASRPIKKSS